MLNFSRAFSKSRTLFKVKLAKAMFKPRRRFSPNLDSYSELEEFLNTPTWKVRDVIPAIPEESQEIDSSVVQKMLKMSGFDTNILKEDEQKLMTALKTQIAFIDHLYEPGEDKGGKSENSAEIFRLLSSDHHPPTPLTLKELLKQVEELEERVCEERGENGFEGNIRTTITNKIERS